MLYDVAEFAVRAINGLIDQEKRKERLYDTFLGKHPGYRDPADRFGRAPAVAVPSAPKRQERFERRRDTRETNNHSVVGESVIVYNFNGAPGMEEPFEGLLMTSKRKPRHPKGRPRPQRVF